MWVAAILRYRCIFASTRWVAAIHDYWCIFARTVDAIAGEAC